jgi:photosystem II stability/assembly factor-like uncharacterized protein
MFATKYRAFGVTALVLAGALTLAGCASASNSTPDTDPATSSAFEHIHGLAFDSGADYGLVATHDGLYRFPLATTNPVMPSQLDGPQGGLRSDFMGITSFDGSLYASGHPNASAADSGPNLGLLRSTDAGLSWTRASSTAAADYHSLTAGRGSSGTVVLHGLNSITSAIETSTDGGQSWTVGATLAARSLVADPAVPGRIYATTEKGLQRSDDNGQTFALIAGSPNLYLLTAIHDPSVGTLIGIAVNGAVWLKTPTENWTQTGTVTGPADAIAFGSTTTPILLVSDQTGVTISHDLGTTWQLAVSR